MRGVERQALALLLCATLAFLPLTGCASRQQTEAAIPRDPSPLRGYLQKSYLELFELAPRLEFSAREIEGQRQALRNGKDMCVRTFEDHANRYSSQMDQARAELKEKSARITESERNSLHCRIQNLELLRSEAQALAGHAIPTAYDNLDAKLEIIEKWPAVRQQIQREIADGTYLQRRWGDVKDIGFREIAAGQEDDIRRGQEAIAQMRRNGMLPPEVEDKRIQEYVNAVALRVARASDLKIPLHVTVLQSREINAFALPGGYLFIERGLLEAADNEAQLAGVLAHEIAHDTARHSAKLMRRATIASIFYQAAQVAAVVLTGGVAGIGVYYALQYGFFGLGLVLDLKLLGVSRDYELEADQLGVQYAWNAGYDPAGFIEFFDKMATREGYVNSVSWFRTHPPFFQRMVDTEREIAFLPPKPQVITQTSAFEQMKKELEPIKAQAEKEDADKPSLLISRAEGCEPPKKIEYEPGQPIERLCASPPRNAEGAGAGR